MHCTCSFSEQLQSKEVQKEECQVQKSGFCSACLMPLKMTTTYLKKAHSRHRWWQWCNCPRGHFCTRKSRQLQIIFSLLVKMWDSFCFRQDSYWQLFSDSSVDFVAPSASHPEERRVQPMRACKLRRRIVVDASSVSSAVLSFHIAILAPYFLIPLFIFLVIGIFLIFSFYRSTYDFWIAVCKWQ